MHVRCHISMIRIRIMSIFSLVLDLAMGTTMFRTKCHRTIHEVTMKYHRIIHKVITIYRNRTMIMNQTIMSKITMNYHKTTLTALSYQ